MKNLKKMIFWFLKGLVLSILELSTLIMAIFSCVSLGFLLGVLIGSVSSSDSLIRLSVCFLLVSAILFPLFFYLVPRLRMKWKRPVIKNQNLDKASINSFIAYYHYKNSDKTVYKDITYINIASKEKNDLKLILERFLLKIPFLGTVYAKRLDFEEKMKDTSFAIGYSLKRIKRKVFFGFGLLFFLFFAIGSFFYTLLPGIWCDIVFYTLYGLIFILTILLPTVQVDLYRLGKLYKKLDQEKALYKDN